MPVEKLQQSFRSQFWFAGNGIQGKIPVASFDGNRAKAGIGQSLLQGFGREAHAVRHIGLSVGHCQTPAIQNVHGTNRQAGPRMICRLVKLVLGNKPGNLLQVR